MGQVKLLGHAALVWERACFAPLLPSVTSTTHIPTIPETPYFKNFLFYGTIKCWVNRNVNRQNTNGGQKCIGYYW